MKIKELALLTDGVVEGDGDIDITGLCGIESVNVGDLTFALTDDILSLAEKSETSCILTTRFTRKSSKALIRVNNPKLSFVVIYNAFHNFKSQDKYIHPTAVVADSAKLGKNVSIGSHVSIEEKVVIGDHTIIESGVVIKSNCEIGTLCHIHPNVTLYKNTILKNHVTLHSGVVVGSDGFGYVKDKGKIHKFPQMGKVIIEDDVEIGANSTIDRGSLSDTIIGAGSKLDNLCHVAHNVKIGKNLIMAAQSGIAGSTTIGDNVTISGQVAVTDNIKVGNNVVIAGKSGVIKDVADNEVILGMPARPIAQAKRQMAVLAWMTKHFTVLSRTIKDSDNI